MRVLQYVDILHENDGIGNDIEGISRQLDELNIPNLIVTRKNNTKKKTFCINRVFSQKSDINILHYGGYGFPIDFFLSQKGIKILRFHNVTPVHFFLPYLTEEVASIFLWNYKKANLEIYSLVQHCDFIWCDSFFNLKTLENLIKIPKEKAVVIPIQKDFSLRPRTSKKPKTITFIGRWVPNKKLEDLLFILYFLVKVDSDYSLHLVGKRSEIFYSYNQKIFNIIQILDLNKNVVIHENISEEEKSQILDSSQIFLCMSEHEGFCIPILEAMSHNVLVFSYVQEAVVEICREGGILFKEKDFLKIAQIIHEVLQNESLVGKILQGQEQTLNHYKKSRLKEFLLQFMKF